MLENFLTSWVADLLFLVWLVAVGEIGSDKLKPYLH